MAFLVAFEEKFFAYDSLFINDIGAGIRDAGEPAARHLFVANAPGVDGLAAFVGQERIGDVFFFRELLENVERIVANRHELQTGFFNLL